MKKLRQKLKSLITGKPTGPIMLNVGCGTDYKKGWVNIDNNSDGNITKLDLNFDLRNPLPYKAGTVDFIFHEHFLEHLTPDEGRTSLGDFMRVLKPGGVMRIAMPDLEESIKLYLDKDWRTAPVITNHNMQFVQTPAELLNMSFSWWGHKWLYDWAELDRRLREVGATKFYRVKHSQSDYPELRGLETRQESVLVAEVVKQ